MSSYLQPVRRRIEPQRPAFGPFHHAGAKKMTQKIGFKTSFWAVALVALVLVSAGFLKARHVDSANAEPVGANVLSSSNPNVW
jgi:hypothetical protein